MLSTGPGFKYNRGTQETVALVESVAEKRKAILDVGCGDGAIARMLLDAGYAVTAIDGSEKAVANAEANGVPVQLANFHAFSSSTRYDIVLFARSLHHMHPLELALERVAALLADDGLLIVDDFGAELVDMKTALWFYGLKSLLGEDTMQHGHGPLLEAGHIPADPLGTWRHHHFNKHEVIESGTLVEALRRTFSIISVERLPYLYQYFVNDVSEEQGEKIFRWESALCAAGAIEPIGVRVIARSFTNLPH